MARSPIEAIANREHVVKTGGDYSFEGEVVARFYKLSGKERVVVENADGILHIFNPSQLSPSNQEGAGDGDGESVYERVLAILNSADQWSQLENEDVAKRIATAVAGVLYAQIHPGSEGTERTLARVMKDCDELYDEQDELTAKASSAFQRGFDACRKKAAQGNGFGRGEIVPLPEGVTDTRAFTAGLNAGVEAKNEYIRAITPDTDPQEEGYVRARQELDAASREADVAMERLKEAFPEPTPQEAEPVPWPAAYEALGMTHELSHTPAKGADEIVNRLRSDLMDEYDLNALGNAAADLIESLKEELIETQGMLIDRNVEYGQERDKVYVLKAQVEKLRGPLALLVEYLERCDHEIYELAGCEGFTPSATIEASRAALSQTEGA